MHDASERLVAYTRILQPTAAGIIVCVAVSILALIAHQLPAIQNQLDIPANWNAGSVLLTIVGDILVKFLGTSKVDTVILSLFWAAVGLIVYLFLRAAIAFVSELAEDVFESGHYVRPRQKELRGEMYRLTERTFFRLIILVIMWFYSLWLINFFLRGSTAGNHFARHGNGELLRDGILFVANCLAVYGLIVLLRLFMLRDRLVR